MVRRLHIALLLLVATVGCSTTTSSAPVHEAPHAPSSPTPPPPRRTAACSGTLPHDALDPRTWRPTEGLTSLYLRATSQDTPHPLSIAESSDWFHRIAVECLDAKQLDDCDETSLVCTLSVLRAAVLDVDHVRYEALEQHEALAATALSVALDARADVVEAFEHSEQLSPRFTALLARVRSQQATATRADVEAQRQRLRDDGATQGTGWCKPQACASRGPCTALFEAVVWDGQRCVLEHFGGCTASCDRGNAGTYASCRDFFATCSAYVEPPALSAEEREAARLARMRATYDALLSSVRSAYETATQAFIAKDYDTAGSSFAAAMKAGARSGEIFEKHDGFWTYKSDELTQLYALSSFYLALSNVLLHLDEEVYALLCDAFNAAPDVISKQPVPRAARKLVAKARSKCIVTGGWRSTIDPHWHDYAAEPP